MKQVDRKDGERQGEGRDERRTESGIEVGPLYRPEAVEGLEYEKSLADLGRVSLHPWAVPLDVPRPAVDHAPVRGLQVPPRRPTSVSST